MPPLSAVGISGLQAGKDVNRFDRQKIIKAIKKICKIYNVDVEIQNGTPSGAAIPWESEIVVKFNHHTPLNLVLSITFHEIAHVICHRRGIYAVYNSDIWHKEAPSRREISIFRRTALKAERYADKLGSKLMKKHCPIFDFVGFYDNKKGIKMNKEVVNRAVRMWEAHKKAKKMMPN